MHKNISFRIKTDIETYVFYIAEKQPHPTQEINNYIYGIYKISRRNKKHFEMFRISYTVCFWIEKKLLFLYRICFEIKKT